MTPRQSWQRDFNALIVYYKEILKPKGTVRLHTAINRADFVSWCMLYTYDGYKMHS